MQRSSLGLILITFLAMTGAGCGFVNETSRPPRTYPVSGRVLRNGKPVEHAQIVFSNPGAPKTAVGETNSEGDFTLTTEQDNDGAVAGEHVVTLFKTMGPLPEASTQPSSAEELAKQAAAGMKAPELDPNVPAQYTDASTSPLRATVKPDATNDFLFELK